MNRRVAVTGMGAITPVGNNARATWEALKAGRSGVGRITTFDASTFPVQIAGMVKDFTLSDYVSDHSLERRLSRAGGFGVASALQALRDAGLDENSYAPHERGISMAGSVGRAELQEMADMSWMLHSTNFAEFYRQSPSDVLVRDQNTAVAAIGILANVQGPIIGVSTACTGSSHALGEGFRRVQEGDAKVMIAGGYDALTTWLDVLGFALLGALTSEYNDDPTHASRPFDHERSGFVLGEGAVTLILEEMESARARGAKIYAEILGYGSSMNAYRMTDPPPDGEGTSLAMSAALRDSGLQPEQFEYVVAHGTGTSGNDICETISIKRVFGDHAYKLAISSPKSMTGHLTSAAGGLNMLAAIYAMNEGIVSPTINLDHPDPKLDLDYVPNTARAMPVHAVMVNAFAFGGTNAVLVVADPAMRN
jgi:3-oxoacyl-[acyl-carrier-protein] synthase II